MNVLRIINISRPGTVVVVIIALVFILVPIALGILSGGFYQSLKFSAGEWVSPLLRSIAFGVIVSSISMGLGLSFALILSKSASWISILLPLLLTPLFVGSFPAGVIWKMNLLSFPYIDELLWSMESTWQIWIFLGISQLWYLLPPTTFMLYYSIQAVRKESLDLANGHLLSDACVVRDVFLPYCRAPALVLMLFTAFLAAQEFSRPYLLVRPSPGMNNELIGHWLLRLAQNYNAFAPDRTGEIVRTVGSSVGLVCAGFGLFQLLTFSRVYQKMGALLSGIVQFPRSDQRVATFISLIIILWVVLPFAFLLNTGEGISISLIVSILPIYGMALPVSIILVITAYLYALLCRVLEPSRFAGASSSFFWYLCGLLLVYALPPIAVIYFFHQFLGWFASSFNSNLAGYLLWTGALFVTVFPLMAAFLHLSFMRTSDNELDFLRTNGIGSWDQLILHYGRFHAKELLLALCLGIVLVANESSCSVILSGMFGDSPSISVILSRYAEGRGFSVDNVATIIWIVFIFSVLLSYGLSYVFTKERI